MKRLLYIILAALLLVGFVVPLFTGCTAYKKSILKKFCVPSSVKSDTIIVNKLDSTYKAKFDSIIFRPPTIIYSTIQSPCDSLGNLRQFEQLQISGNDTLSIKSDGKKIYIKSNCDGCEQRFKEYIEYSKNQLDSASHHSETVTLVKYPIYTVWEKFKLGSWGNILMITGFGAIILIVIHALHQFNKVIP